MLPRHYMHSLEHAASPAAALLSVRPVEFRFGIVHVGIENRAVGTHRNDVVAGGVPRSDPARLSGTHVVVRGCAPFFSDAWVADPVFP